MQKHDKMVALAKEKSAEMTETAITAIETMYRKNIKISVAELTKLTGPVSYTHLTLPTT